LYHFVACSQPTHELYGKGSCATLVYVRSKPYMR